MPGSNILIVDDEPAIRIMLSRMVEPLQHNVYTAEDGQEAFEMTQRVPFDLIVSDLHMPRMDGLTLLQRLREGENDAAFIILTGYGDLPQALRARERYNIANFLVKPIHNLDQFLFDIESAIERRLLEQENNRLLASLQRMNLELEAKVRERTRELEAKTVELERLSDFRADVLKVLGHELRTPLAILSGYFGLALDEPPQFQTLAPRMRASVDRLREIVERALLHLQRSGETTFPLELTSVEPESLCERVVNRLRPFVERRGVQFRLEFGERLGLCRWDREKIEVLFEELLINAVRATPDGNEIRVDMADRGNQLEIRVKDAGAGIPDGERQRIFEPFVVLGDVTQHGSGLFEFGARGLGIGLSTALLWAELHHGRIEARSNRGETGTTFVLILPREVSVGGLPASGETGRLP